MATIDAPLLAVEPEVRRYRAYDDGPGLDELTEVLRGQQGTAPVPIREEEDVLLNHQGMIQRHYRLTTTALQQLCSVLSPGLTDVVRNLSGLRPRTKQYGHERHSVSQAISVLNSLIKFRFDLLEGHCLVMDRRQRQIAGVVGQKYRFLSNLEMLQRVTELLRSRKPEVRFWEAALAGRRLLLRYKSTERAFALPTPLGRREPFYSCLHFSNSELGDCCVKGTAAVYRQWSKTSAMIPFGESTRLVHFRGEKFNEKFRAVLEKSCDLMAEVREAGPGLRRLAEQSLGLTGGQAACESRLAEITAVLSRSVGRKVAEESVRRALVHGSYQAQKVSMGRRLSTGPWDHEIVAAMRERTAYDIFNAMCYVARRLLPARQESVEQRAFELITKSIF